MNTAVVACGAQAAKASEALSRAALAGKPGGDVLLVNGNTAVESQHLETIEGGDSLQDASFLSLHRYDIDTCYMLGGAYVMPDAVLSKTADTIMATLL